MSTTLSVRVPRKHRGAVPICCPNCGYVEFDRAPDLKKVYEYLLKHGPATTAEVAKGTKTSIASASEKLRRLTLKLGLVRITKTANAVGGGKINTYEATARGAE